MQSDSRLVDAVHDAICLVARRHGTEPESVFVEFEARAKERGVLAAGQWLADVAGLKRPGKRPRPVLVYP